MTGWGGADACPWNIMVGRSHAEQSLDQPRGKVSLRTCLFLCILLCGMWLAGPPHPDPSQGCCRSHRGSQHRPSGMPWKGLLTFHFTEEGHQLGDVTGPLGHPGEGPKARIPCSPQLHSHHLSPLAVRWANTLSTVCLWLRHEGRTSWGESPPCVPLGTHVSSQAVSTSKAGLELRDNQNVNTLPLPIRDGRLSLRSVLPR